MSVTLTHLEAFLEKMETEATTDLAIRSFSFYYEQLVQGETGMIGDVSICPVAIIPDYDKLGHFYKEIGAEVLSQTAMLKLNGGLGTGMGLQKAKSLLPVRGELAFLDIIARQAIHWDVSLILMNSFSTVADSRQKLVGYKELRKDVPADFEQHKIPKINQATLEPVEWPEAPALEWCPPGHGDIYTALVTTGTLQQLLDAGIKYMFVSNSDNLGATMDPLLLGYFARHNLPFLMEVADRTEADRKGGHLAFNGAGRFLLRESAQCPGEDMGQFQDITRHKFFNTNNLWVNLEALKAMLDRTDGILGLPMIRNIKTVDPRLHNSTPVYQLETAMGAAIAVFDGAGAIRVPRSRFAPVKTTNEWLAVQSDAYVMRDDFSLVLHEERNHKPCTINLDRSVYKTVDVMAERFPAGAPSLKKCNRLEVAGDVYFGEGVICEGDVVMRNVSGKSKHIADRTVLSGEVIIS